MTEKKKALLNKKSELLNSIKNHGDFIKGSVTRIYRNGKLISGYNLTSKNENQKTVTKYISKKQLSQAQRGIKEMKKVRKLIEKISQLNLEILKKG